MKSSVDEIRKRFDADVERFASLETGQSATMDAPLVLDLIATNAAAVTPSAKRLLDVGCGAGNYSLKMLEKLPALGFTLVDLSQPMLDRARQRLSAVTKYPIQTFQSDIRLLDLPDASFDLVLAGAVLHHLRTDDEWHSVFAKFHRILAPGGSLWISDMVDHDLPAAQTELFRRYGQYLADLKGPEYRDQVFDYIHREDTPRSLTFQLDLLKKVGFPKVEVLHKNAVFAAFGAQK